MTRHRTIIAFISISILLSGCSALIYAIRGPKYEGKFREENYLEVLRNQYYYTHYDRSADFNDSIRVNGIDTFRITRNYSKHTYVFVRHDNDGIIRYKSIGADFPLAKIPSKEEIDTLPVVNERYYVIKDSLIKYEVYHDSYNGYNLFKARIYNDSLVVWQVGISKMFLTTYNKIID